jgi:hypothetical protein
MIQRDSKMATNLLAPPTKSYGLTLATFLDIDILALALSDEAEAETLILLSKVFFQYQFEPQD